MKEIVPQDIVKIESATPVTITLKDGRKLRAYSFEVFNEHDTEAIEQWKQRVEE